MKLYKTLFLYCTRSRMFIRDFIMATIPCLLISIGLNNQVHLAIMYSMHPTIEASTMGFILDSSLALPEQVICATVFSLLFMIPLIFIINIDFKDFYKTYFQLQPRYSCQKLYVVEISYELFYIFILYAYVLLTTNVLANLTVTQRPFTVENVSILSYLLGYISNVNIYLTIRLITPKKYVKLFNSLYLFVILVLLFFTAQQFSVSGLEGFSLLKLIPTYTLLLLSSTIFHLSDLLMSISTTVILILCTFVIYTLEIKVGDKL